MKASIVKRSIYVLIFTLFGITSCGQPPPNATPAPITSFSSTPSVKILVSPGSSLAANSSVSVIVEVEPAQALDFLKWTVTGTGGGSVTPDTGGQVVYTAGPNPGVDIVVAEGTTPEGIFIHETTTITVESGPEPTAVIPIDAEKWPSDPEAAAKFFANGKGEWTQNPENGWTLSAEWPPIEVNVPAGVTLEGYTDGVNPPDTFKCYTVLGPGQVKIQGGTFWLPDDPDDPAYTAKRVHQIRKDKNCEAIGFTPE
ncbi:MAG: hypothetical protein JNK32_04640 [Anaerolineales bacterium]|nr:hypothetical protein [Anaerolineales bacterium]